MVQCCVEDKTVKNVLNYLLTRATRSIFIMQCFLCGMLCGLLCTYHGLPGIYG